MNKYAQRRSQFSVLYSIVNEFMTTVPYNPAPVWHGAASGRHALPTRTMSTCRCCCATYVASSISEPVSSRIQYSTGTLMVAKYAPGRPWRLSAPARSGGAVTFNNGDDGRRYYCTVHAYYACKSAAVGGRNGGYDKPRVGPGSGPGCAPDDEFGFYTRGE